MTFDVNAALAWVHAGCSVVPTKTDGSKSPAAFWKTYQSERADDITVTQWAGTYDGFGVVGGAVSGNLEMFEFEGRAITAGLLPALSQALTDNDLGDIWVKLAAGYMQASPAGGLHFVYRVDGPARGNTKLARRPATPDELAAIPGERVKILIETRGEGGQFVAAPSTGRTHPSGQPWVALHGRGPADVITLTVDERDALHAIASMFDELPAADPLPPMPAGPRSLSDGKRPGDDYNDQTTWDDILLGEGWTKIRRLGNGFGWRRPGKDDYGISATTGQSKDGVDRLYVFTTSTEFESEKPYTKFAAYALLKHSGDYTTAAKELRRQGYGDPPPKKASVPAGTEKIIPPKDASSQTTESYSDPGAKLPPITTSVDGNLATVHELPHRAPGGTLDHTDDANALRLVAAHADVIRRVMDAGKWFGWDTWRWRMDHDEATVRELAKALARSLPQADKDDKAFKRNSLSSAGLSACIRVAASDPKVTLRAGDLDSHPTLLNTPGGIVDLRTGEIQPHDSHLLITRGTACRADLGATHPHWDQFLKETFDGDTEMIGYLQRLAGLALLGDVREHVLPLFYGVGANGKGVTLLVWQMILGVADTGGYAMSAPDGFLMTGREGKHETEIARLRGARLLIASEQTGGKRFDEAKIKRLTGGDMLTGRLMRGDFFDFPPSHLIVVATNHLPEVREGGPSFWRRARLIPFNHVVPEDRRDPELHNRLVDTEGPAILGWMVRGAMAVIAGGLSDPARVKAATEEYRVSEDTLASFVRDECTVGSAWWVKVAELTKRYEAHCRDMGQDPLSQRGLTMRLTSEFDIESARMPNSSRARIYRGIGLMDDESDNGE